jgi:hypothetical protein
LLGAIALAPVAPESPLLWWIKNSVLTLERLLPLFCLGAAFGIVSVRVHVVAFALFVIGICFGFLSQNWLLGLLIKIPQAPMHHFLTGPIATITIGLALIAGARLRPIILPAVAFIAGSATSLAIVVSDPSLHNPTNAIVGISIVFWIVGSVSLTVRPFRRPWFNVFAPILGSWLIAIGALYGAAALIPKRSVPLMEPMPTPGLDSTPGVLR